MNASIFFKSRGRPIHLDGKTGEWITRTGNRAAIPFLGSARDSRAGDRVFAIANFSA